MKMKLPSAVKNGWEHRFPGLTGKWTHWKITGDGQLLAVVEGVNLSRALDVVEQNYGRYASIKASRATVDANAELSEEESAGFEISRFIYDEQIRKSLPDA
jgi:hypothetical protein